MNNTQLAVKQVGQAIKLLESSKQLLSQARSDQFIPLAIALDDLKVISNILLDFELTPAIAEGDTHIFDDGDHYDPDHDPYIWNHERIEATKSLMFAEALANGELR